MNLCGHVSDFIQNIQFPIVSVKSLCINYYPSRFLCLIMPLKMNLLGSMKRSHSDYEEDDDSSFKRRRNETGRTDLRVLLQSKVGLEK